MRRRALLAAFASSAATTTIAGCLDPVASDPTTTDQNGSRTRSTTTTTVERTTGERRTVDTGDASVSTCEPSTPTYDLAPDAPADAEFAVRDLSVSTTYDRPETRFLLEPDAFYSAAAVERAREDRADEVVVVDIEAVHDRAVRDAIRTAIEEGEWRADEVPYGLRQTVERVDFVTGVSNDDTYTHVGVALHEFAVDAPPAIEFDAAVADRYGSPGDPASVSFWVSNAREREWTVSAGTVPPFGMLRAHPAAAGTSGDRGDDAREFLLWRDYEEEGCYSRTDDHWVVCAIGSLTPIPPCESVAREYAILPSDTPHYPDLTVPENEGTYVVTGTVSYTSRQLGGQSATLDWEVTFDLDRP